MSQTSVIADRHSRVTPGLGDELKPLQVSIVADKALAAPWAQHLLVALVNMLARMVGGVASISLSLPAVRLITFIPGPAADGNAFQQLSAFAKWAVGDDVVVTDGVGVENDMTIFLGCPPNTAYGTADLCAVGSGWRAWVGHPENFKPLSAADQLSRNPLGPYLAAAMAAGEVFKRSRGLLKGRFADDDGYSLWSGIKGRWAALQDGPEIAALQLPAFYLVGAGAIGQALLAILAAAEVSALFVVTIDDDIHDITNLNRCFIAGTSDVREPKVSAVTRLRVATGQAGFEHWGTLQHYLSSSHRIQIPTDLQRAEDKDRFALVISAVDKNSSRNDIQGLNPGRVIGASTIGLSAKANDYDMQPGNACLACHNPSEEDGARLREVEQVVRGMGEVEQRRYLEGQVENVDAVLAYLAGAEGCGSVGEADLRAFSLRATPEFSASFVSLIAAVLLAGRLMTVAMSDASKPARLPMSVFSTKNVGASDEILAAEPSCPHCGRQGRACTVC